MNFWSSDAYQEHLPDFKKWAIDSGKAYVKREAWKYGRKKLQEGIKSTQDYVDDYIKTRKAKQEEYAQWALTYIKADKAGKPLPVHPDLAQTAAPTAAPTKRPASQMSKALVNIPQSTQMGRQGTDGGEVPVMPVKKAAKIHPDYFTVQLPMIETFYNDTLNPANLTYTSDNTVFTLRLNSIFDPFKNTLVGKKIINVNGTFGAENTSDVTELQLENQPQGRDIWAAHFKYYRVLACDVRVTTLSMCPVYPSDNGKDHPAYNSFVVGYELTDEDGNLSNNAKMFEMTKRAHTSILPACPTTVYWNGSTEVNKAIASSVNVTTYSYNPNAWVYHVEEKGSEERWTPIGANPSIDHDFNFRIMHQDPTAPAGKIDLKVEIIYTVQFREALDSVFKLHTTGDATYPDADGQADD